MRIGIVGAGFMGTTHAAGWAETEATLAGFVAQSSAHAQALAEQYQAQVYPDFEALLADVDVVDICNPTHLHYQMVLQAATAGKDIICEKPLARTLAQGREMIAACRLTGVKLLVAHVVRFFPEYAQARVAVANGDIGRPAVVRLTRGTFRPKKAEDNWFVDFEKSGGMMLDLMIHDLDILLTLDGSEAVQVDAVGVPVLSPKFDIANVRLRFGSGLIANLTASRISLEKLRKFRVWSHRTYVSADFVTRRAQVCRLVDGEKGPEIALEEGVPAEEEPLRRQLDSFLGAVREGRPPEVSGLDGRRALALAHTILSRMGPDSIGLGSPATAH